MSYAYAPEKGTHMYKNLSNRDAIDHAAARVPFSNRGGSLWGRWEGDTFVVYSYATPIATYSPYRVPGWWVTEERYSVTTSRHTNALRRAVA